ncbi:MAG: hypothetical protein GY754_26845 [bacterium]|nr:hypothetical protein [bacterium]
MICGRHNIFVVIILFFTLTSCNKLGLLLTGHSSSTTTLNYAWSIRYNGAVDSYTSFMAIDSSDNVIAVSMVLDDFDLDGNGDTAGTAETSNLSSGATDAVLAKYSSAGVRQWIIRLEGASGPFDFYAITVDSSDNIIITGKLSGPGDLNGDGVILDTNEIAGLGDDDAIVCKFSGSGTLLWSKRFGGTLADRGISVDADSLNNIYVTGTVNGTVDFNGDLDNDETGETPAGIFGDKDIYIVKMDSSGVYQWSKRLGGLTDVDKAYNVHLDINNNIYICGNVADDVDLSGNGVVADETGESDPTGFTDDADCFISSFDSSGTYRWSKRFGHYASSLEEYATTVTSDSNANVYVTGFTSGTGYDLNGDGDTVDGTAETTPYGNKDTYIISFDSSGSSRWMKTLGGTEDDIAWDIDIDADDNIFIIGKVSNCPMDLNGDGDFVDGTAETGAGYGDTDIFVAVFSNTGTSINFDRFGTGLGDQGICLAVGSNFIVLGVYVTGDADLDGDPSTIESTSTDSNADIVMVRYE